MTLSSGSDESQRRESPQNNAPSAMDNWHVTLSGAFHAENRGTFSKATFDEGLSDGVGGMNAWGEGVHADWDNPGVASRECYEIARKHGKSITVMEPIKGGQLASPPTEVQKIFREANPSASFASWAIRYAASLDGIITVLSGMSNVEQMEDNLSYMKNFTPLNPQEQDAIRRAQEVLHGVKSIPCTACHYCTEGCPMEIKIPEFFKMYNRLKQAVSEGTIMRAKDKYQEFIQTHTAPDECVECGQCEDACPQHLTIRDYLKDVSEAFAD